MTNLIDFALDSIDPDLPDSVTFATHPRFLGKNLYPRQKTLLRVIFLETELMTDYDHHVIDEWTKGFEDYSYVEDDSRVPGELVGIAPDVMKRIAWLKENGYPHFQEVINITGRRGSKGFLGGFLGAYQAMKLIRLGDPQAHFGIEEGHDIYMYVIATTFSQAKQYQFADVSNTIVNSRFFEKYIQDAKESYIHLNTPHDLKRRAELSMRGVKVSKDLSTIRIIAASSNSAAARGGAGAAVLLDEFAHMLVGTAGPRTSEKVYNAVVPSLDQLQKEKLIYIPTSPYTKVGKAYSLYQEGLDVRESGAVNPTMLVIQLRSWDLYKDWDKPEHSGKYVGAPQLWNQETKKLEARDPYTFRVERRAQWAEVVDAYLEADVINKLFDDTPVFSAPTSVGSPRHSVQYFGHADPAEDGSANYAAAIGHIEKVEHPEYSDERGRPLMLDHVVIDWMMVWSRSDEGEHDQIQILQDIADVCAKYRVQKFTFDQYGAMLTLPLLKKMLAERGAKTKVAKVTFSDSGNKKRAKDFRQALTQGWVHSYRDEYGLERSSLLENELRFLQLINGKVQKQTLGPVQTKDLCDSVMEVAASLLGPQAERMRKRSELSALSPSFGGTRVDSARKDSSARDRLKSHSRRAQQNRGGPGGGMRPR